MWTCRPALFTVEGGNTHRQDYLLRMQRMLAPLVKKLKATDTDVLWILEEYAGMEYLLAEPDIIS